MLLLLLSCLLTNDFYKKIVDPETGIQKVITISEDDGIRPNSNLADLSRLKPAFKKDGSTTAGTHDTHYH